MNNNEQKNKKVEADAIAVGGIVEAARTAEKSSAVGNAAAMREALFDIVMLTMKVGYSIHGDVACGIIASKAKRALSAPARNCDAMSAEECKRIFEEEMLLHLTSEATEEDKNLILTTAKSVIDDLLAPAAERKGEGDGSK